MDFVQRFLSNKKEKKLRVIVVVQKDDTYSRTQQEQ